MNIYGGAGENTRVSISGSLYKLCRHQKAKRGAKTTDKLEKLS